MTNVLESIAHSISHTSYSTTVVQSSNAISSPYVLCDRPGCDIPLGRHLRAAFYELCRRRHHERRESACRAGDEDFRKRRW